MIISDSKKFIFFHVPKAAGTSLCSKLAPYSNVMDKVPVLKENIHNIIDTLYTPEHAQLVTRVSESMPDNLLSEYYSTRKHELNWMNLVHYKCAIHPTLNIPDVKFARQHLNSQWDKYKDYTRFAIVRNSWDFVFSIFKNKVVVDQVASLYTETDDWDKMIDDRMTVENFRHFMVNLKTEYMHIYNDFFMNQEHNHVLSQQSYFTGPRGRRYADQIIKISNLDRDINKLENQLNIKLQPEKSHNVSTNINLKYQDFYDEQSRDTVYELFSSDIHRYNFNF
jgi:hypothetical protein